MSDNNLVLEILKKLQQGQNALRSDVKEVLTRLNKLERAEGHQIIDSAELHGRVDRMNTRIERIESRLELSD